MTTRERQDGATGMELCGICGLSTDARDESEIAYLAVVHAQLHHGAVITYPSQPGER